MTPYYARFRRPSHAFAIAGLFLLGLFGLSACGGNRDDVRPRPIAAKPQPVTDPGRLAANSPVKIAILLPLSGERAALGRALQRAAEMAVLEAGASNMQLVTFDTRGTAEGAIEAADQAIRQDVKLILGPVFATEVRAVRDRAGAAKLNVIAFSNDQAVAGGNVYLLSFMLKQQVDNVIAYAAKQGKTRIGVLAPQNDYGNQVVQLAKDAAARSNATITRTGFYKPDSMEVTDEVKAFSGAIGVDRRGRVGRGEALDFDAVLIPEGGTKLRMVASVLAYYDVDPDKVKFLGTSRWDDKSLRRETSLRTGWFASPDPNAFERFSTKYQAAHKDEPPRIATLAYDAVAMAAQIARKPDGIDYGSAAITDPAGFTGIDGIFRFRPDGLAERGLAIVEIDRDEFKIVGEAPKSFAAPGTN